MATKEKIVYVFGNARYGMEMSKNVLSMFGREFLTTDTAGYVVMIGEEGLEFCTGHISGLINDIKRFSDEGYQIVKGKDVEGNNLPIPKVLENQLEALAI